MEDADERMNSQESRMSSRSLGTAGRKEGSPALFDRPDKIWIFHRAGHYEVYLAVKKNFKLFQKAEILTGSIRLVKPFKIYKKIKVACFGVKGIACGTEYLKVGHRIFFALIGQCRKVILNHSFHNFFHSHKSIIILIIHRALPVNRFALSAKSFHRRSTTAAGFGRNDAGGGWGGFESPGGSGAIERFERVSFFARFEAKNESLHPLNFALSRRGAHARLTSLWNRQHP